MWTCRLVSGDVVAQGSVSRFSNTTVADVEDQVMLALDVPSHVWCKVAPTENTYLKDVH